MMILYVAVALLVVWLLGRVGVFAMGMLVHLPLLLGLLLLILAFLQARATTWDRPGRRDVQ